MLLTLPHKSILVVKKVARKNQKHKRQHLLLLQHRQKFHLKHKRQHLLQQKFHLNNNLHHAHHALPNLAWYDVPAAARELHSADEAAAGAGLYRSYLEVLLRYAVKPFDRPDHPLSVSAKT